MSEPYYDPSERSDDDLIREEFEEAMGAHLHTPGPWGLSKNVEIWIKAGPVHVATVPRAHDGDWSEANARLIAAAPELLEVVQRCELWFSTAPEGRAMQLVCQAAIEKINGKGGE